MQKIFIRYISLIIAAALVWVCQGDSCISIMKDADMAMYETKAAGRVFLADMANKLFVSYF